MSQFLLASFLILLSPISQAQLVEVSNEYVDLARSFNENCTGSEDTSTEVMFGKPLVRRHQDIEEALEDFVIESLSLYGSSDPNFSELQDDLNLLNVGSSITCSPAQDFLESKFDVYGLKGWIPRAGASAYALVHKSNKAPYVIFMRSSFSF